MIKDTEGQRLSSAGRGLDKLLSENLSFVELDEDELSAQRASLAAAAKVERLGADYGRSLVEPFVLGKNGPQVALFVEDPDVYDGPKYPAVSVVSLDDDRKLDKSDLRSFEVLIFQRYLAQLQAVWPIVKDVVSDLRPDQDVELSEDQLAAINRFRLCLGAAKGLAYDVIWDSKFATFIAHEINSAGTLLLMDLHPDYFPLDEDSLQALRSSMEEMDEILCKFLPDQVKGGLKSADFDLQPLLVDLLRAPNFRGIRAEASEGLNVHFGEVLFGQILRTFLKNALNAHAQNIEIKAFVQEEKVVLDITDDGDPIPPDIAKKIFRDRLPSASGGMGIALLVCAKMLKDFGGTVEFIPSDEGYKTLRVTLPLVEIPQASEATPEEVQEDVGDAVYAAAASVEVTL